MEAVGKLARLESLNLDHTGVGDAGIAKLTGLTRLVDLQLDSVALTDAGAAHLGRLSSLRDLDLYHTLVSEKGFQQLNFEFRIQNSFTHSKFRIPNSEFLNSAVELPIRGQQPR